MTRPGPSFIIAGAPRSGTTWLYHLLDRHPDIYMAKPVRPEPKFFLVDELYARGFQYYVDTWFADAGGHATAGEKTTNYLESAVAAARIHEHLPHVRLIFILREPAQRAYSNWAWSTMNGMETEDFETALAREDERERTLEPRLRFARPYAYFSRGLYAEMLRPYFDRFPREQIVCVKFDDIIRKPGDLASRLHRFVEVPERQQDAEGLDVVNPSEHKGETIPVRAREWLRERYVAPNLALARLLGSDFETWEDL
jgi:Sulfotransferase domain